MFEVGDYIVYGTNGVCKVEAKGPMEGIQGITKNRIYYTLLPIYSQGSKVYTPIDNEKVTMRPIISRDEALELIENINEIDSLWVADEKRREEVYREALKSGSCKELIKIIKTLYLRTQSRLLEGKKVTAVDEKYLHIAEEQLYGELAIPLNMEKDQIEAYIINSANKSDC